MVPNSLYCGDCLEVLAGWPSGQVDLIYLDPPFNSKAKYNQLFGTEAGVPAQVRAFTETWTWNGPARERYERLSSAVTHPAHKATLGLYGILGETGMLAYLTYMAERLVECKRVLKPTGTIYLHCDPTTSHYLKIVMDAVFEARHFRNEIVWCYTGPGSSRRDFAPKHDTILRYVKGESWTFNVDKIRVPYIRSNVHHRQPSSTAIGPKFTAEDVERHRRRGKVPETWWAEFSPAGRTRREYLGYPTQKPRALLERIIQASSNRGDLVLDPFCGCGTTIAAADRLDRQWIGIDISPFAVRLVRDRRLKDASVSVYGIPTDLEGARLLLQANAHDFERWMVMSIDGLLAAEMEAGDAGIDGRGRMLVGPEDEEGLVFAEAKGGGYTASALRDFEGAMARFHATAGIFITLERVDSKRAHAAAAMQGTYKVAGSHYPRLQFWSAEEHLAGIQPALPTMADPYTGQPSQPSMLLD